MKLNEIKDIFTRQNVEFIGCCKFEDTLPLIECRSISHLPKNAKTVIVCLFPYYTGRYEKRNISRYSLSDDYHNLVGNMLKIFSNELSIKYPLNEFVCFVDNSPIREVHTAYLSRIGNIGKNNQLINSKYGTYTFIGEIVTDLEITNDVNYDNSIKCINCNACINSCPTNALKNNKFDKNICRSNITQKKGELTDWEKQQIKTGNYVWGCDICNDVCPLNKNPELTPIMAMYNNICPQITIDNVKDIIENKAFGYRGIKVISRNIELIRSNSDGNFKA